MRLRIHQVLGTLLSFYVWASLARSVHETKRYSTENRYFDNGDESNGFALEPRNVSELVVRDVDVDMPDDSPPGIGCRTLCSAVTKPVKRGWIELDPRSALEKRFDDVWPPLGSDKGKDSFMRNTCDALTPEQEIIPPWAQSGTGYASAVTAALGNTKVRFGMQQICGCTMLFVVSHKRVYLGHYWEDVSFGKDANQKYPLQFAKQVTNFLKSGFTAPGGPAQDSLQLHAADFQSDPGLHAYILSPDTSEDPTKPNGKFLYPDKIRSMASTVATILGITPEEVTKETYVAVDKSKDSPVLTDTAAGHMVFDYVPKGGPGGTRKDPLAAWRIIWQRELILADQWKLAPAT